MNGLYNFFAQTFGPLVQIIFSLSILLIGAWCICSVAFWSERKLIRIHNSILRMLPFPFLAAGLLYGGLRFSGQLLYSTDGWDQWGHWNYTNQNSGVCVLFVCGCMLIGAALALHREKNFAANFDRPRGD